MCAVTSSPFYVILERAWISPVSLRTNLLGFVLTTPNVGIPLMRRPLTFHFSTTSPTLFLSFLLRYLTISQGSAP